MMFVFCELSLALSNPSPVTKENPSLEPARAPDASSPHLVSRALHQAGDLAAAREHAGLAAQLEPGTALYANHRQRLVAP